MNKDNKLIKYIRDNTDVADISIRCEISQDLKQRLRDQGTEQDKDPKY